VLGLQLLVSSFNSGEVKLYQESQWEDQREIQSHSSCSVHDLPVVSIHYIKTLGAAISLDSLGNIEFWDPENDFKFPELEFEMVTETDFVQLLDPELHPLISASVSRD
jgi:hypothetical protein